MPKMPLFRRFQIAPNSGSGVGMCRAPAGKKGEEEERVENPPSLFRPCSVLGHEAFEGQTKERIKRGVLSRKRKEYYSLISRKLGKRHSSFENHLNCIPSMTLETFLPSEKAFLRIHEKGQRWQSKCEDYFLQSKIPPRDLKSTTCPSVSPFSSPSLFYSISIWEE